MGLVRGMGTRAGGSRDGGTDRGEGGTRGGRFCPNDALARRVDRRARGSEGRRRTRGAEVRRGKTHRTHGGSRRSGGQRRSRATTRRPTAPPSTRVAETRAGRILTRGAAADAATRGAVIIAKDIPREREDVRASRCRARADMPAASATSRRAIRIPPRRDKKFLRPSDRVEIPPAEALRTPVEFRDACTATTRTARLRSTSRRSRIHLATRRRYEPPLPPPSSSFSFSSSSPPVASARLNPSLAHALPGCLFSRSSLNTFAASSRIPPRSSASPRHSRGGRYQCSGSMNGRPSCA